jgi:predicted glycosyltransferase
MHELSPIGKHCTQPTLLFYCQHSLGIGHLTRSFALAAALAQRFRVVFLNGGRLPPGVQVPADIERIDLPPLGMDDGHTLVSRDAQHDVLAALVERQRLIQQALARTRPAVLLVELFPFGRKKFAGEILPLIRAARRQPGGPAQVVCSLRDILVDARPDQQHHDNRARWLADRYFDAVLVHADPAFAQLQDSFCPNQPLRTKVHYTGFVVPERVLPPTARRGRHLLVSAGGGIVGEDLFRAALAARERLTEPLPLRIVAGPFLPEPHWQALQRQVRGLVGVELLRHVPDMVAEMRRARVSLSQCGYNTALDLVVSGVPALVVPYRTETENEQSQRALRLAELGAVQHLETHAAADPSTLARALAGLLDFWPRPAALALDGADRSTEILAGLLCGSQVTPHQELLCTTP